MEVLLPCECGQKIEATDLQAGLRLRCRCGREVAVPSLGEIRRMSGSQSHISPGLEIETLIANGELPSTRNCVTCQDETDEVVDIYAICDTAEVVDSKSSGQLGAFFLFGALGALAVSAWRTTSTIRGSDRDQRLPVRLCSQCQSVYLDRSARWPILLLVLGVIALGVMGVMATHIHAIGFVTVIAAFATWVSLHALADSRDQVRMRKLLGSEPLFVSFLRRHSHARLRVAGREKISAR